MRAADTAEGSGNAEVVPLDRSAPPHHATPVYAERRDEVTGAFDVEVDVRRWTSQAAQWLIIFAVLGLIIGGAKWWTGRQAAAATRATTNLPPLAAAPRPAPADPAAGDSSVASTTAGDAATPRLLGSVPVTDPAPATHGPSIGDPFATSEAPARSAPPEPTASGTASTARAAGTVNAPTVRAPADVPYPRRVYDVAPQVPAGARVQRGIAVLTLLIDTAGNVAEVELLRSLDPVLDDAAIAAALQWKFEPTLRNDRPVAVRSNFTVRFGY